MSKKEINDVLERIKQVLAENSDSSLARALDTTPQTISSWKIRNSIPYSKCVDIALQHGVSLDWLLTGIGEMYKGSAAVSPALSPREAAMLELFNALDETAQGEIRTAAEEKKRLKDVEQQLQELSLRLERLNSAR